MKNSARFAERLVSENILAADKAQRFAVILGEELAEDLVTKDYLTSEIERLKNDLTRTVIAVTGVGVVAVKILDYVSR